VGKLAVIGILVAMLLASCGGEDPAAMTQKTAPSATATPTSTPTATPTPDHSSGYPRTVRRVFIRRCVKDDSRSYCHCLFDYVAQRVPYGKFSRLADGKVPRAVDKAVEAGIDECG
jgi:hypothetical protein